VTKKHVVALLALLAWCVALRLPTIPRSVIDWDESVYLLMADQWSHGHLPYTAVWDHKPVGAYALFRMGFALFGRSVLSARLLVTVFVFLGAWLLYAIAALLLDSRRAAAVAAIAYPAFSLRFGGTAANTELFFVTPLR